MHEHRREVVLELAVAVPDGLDLVLETLDVQLGSQDLGRDVSAARVEVLLEVVVDEGGLQPVGRGQHVVDEGGDGLGEGLFLDS